MNQSYNIHSQCFIFSGLERGYRCTVVAAVSQLKMRNFSNDGWKLIS